MKLLVDRFYKGTKYTVGKLYIDGKYICDTMEDKDRSLTQDTTLDEIKKKKVYGQTAIPTGTYKIVVNNSPKFKRNLPRLLNVPGFDGVLIHRGNTHEDSAGCILVGENKLVGKVVNSTKYEKLITELLTAAQNRNEEITITIK